MPKTVAAPLVQRRRAVRALVLAAPGARVLLLRFRHPYADGDLWVTPGGGVHPGECDVEALRREVWEETGLRIAGVPPLVWKREHVYPHEGAWIRQAEAIYLANVAPFVPTSANNPEADEQTIFRGFRWWTAAEIRASDERFVPLGLADHIDALLANGPPAAPLLLDG